MSYVQLIFLLVLLSSGLAECSMDHPRLVLLGWTGDGKTEFCNRYDGTMCPREHGESDEESSTTTVYFGKSMLDTPGFGENRKSELSKDSLQASLGSIKKTLLGINATAIRAIAWMVPCAERRTKTEAFDLMKLFLDMVGKAVPIVAIFNPASAHNTCVKKPQEFQKLCAKHGVAIKEVINFDDFQLDTFEKTYATSFRVIVPHDLQQLLQRRDPHFLASQLKKIRELRCQSLPKEVQSLRKSLHATRKAMKGEDEFPLCRRGDCSHIPKPSSRDCSRTVCMERAESCGGWGPFETCDIYCKREQVIEDPGCMQANAQAAQHASELLRQCTEAVEAEASQCLETREKSIANQIDKNEELQKSVDLLLREEQVMLAKLRTCDKADGSAQDEL